MASRRRFSSVSAASRSATALSFSQRAFAHSRWRQSFSLRRRSTSVGAVVRAAGAHAPSGLAATGGSARGRGGRAVPGIAAGPPGTAPEDAPAPPPLALAAEATGFSVSGLGAGGPAKEEGYAERRPQTQRTNSVKDDQLPTPSQTHCQRGCGSSKKWPKWSGICGGGGGGAGPTKLSPGEIPPPL